jgi:hypothetical protein
VFHYKGNKLAVPANIKLTRKKFTTTNTLAYFFNALVHNEEKYYETDTCGQCYKTLFVPYQNSVQINMIVGQRQVFDILA